MAQEFTIKNEVLEEKINQLLPSQGGYGAGVDFSASSMIVPIVDLTESAAGSTLREDLQTSLSLSSITSFSVTNTTSTLINTTGYYRVFGFINLISSNSLVVEGSFSLTDGLSTKIIALAKLNAASTLTRDIEFFDFNVFLQAGESLTATSASNSVRLQGNTRQIADISGNLVNP